MSSVQNGLTEPQLHAAWDALKKDGPGKWLKTNLLIIAGGGNSTGPKGVEYFLSGEKMPGSTTHKFRLGPSIFKPNISVWVQSYKMLEGPPKHNGSGAFHLAPALALPDKPDKDALAVTGQLSGCTVAVGGDPHHTVVIHVRPTGGYAGKAKELQDDAEKYGLLLLQPSDAHGTRVTHAFGRKNYPGDTQRATVLGWYGGGTWVFYAQHYEGGGSPGPGPYAVVAFAANMPVTSVVH